MENESSGLKRGEEKETLLTNIRAVGYQGMTIHCSAVLLTEGGIGIFDPAYTVRGFGTEAAWDNFSVNLRPEAFPYTLTPFENQMVKMLKEGSDVPESIFTGNVLRFADGTEFHLYAAQNNKPIDVHVQHGDICAVWEILTEKAIEYWDAPHMPHLNYQSAAGLRALMMGKKALRETEADLAQRKTQRPRQTHPSGPTLFERLLQPRPVRQSSGGAVATPPTLYGGSTKGMGQRLQQVLGNLPAGEAATPKIVVFFS